MTESDSFAVAVAVTEAKASAVAVAARLTEAKAEYTGVMSDDIITSTVLYCTPPRDISCRRVHRASQHTPLPQTLERRRNGARDRLAT